MKRLPLTIIVFIVANALGAIALLSSVLLPVNALAQLVTVEPASASSITSGNTEGPFVAGDEYNAARNFAYTDNSTYFVTTKNQAPIPTEFSNHRMIHTKHADRGSTGASGVVEFTPPIDIQYCVWHAAAITSKPTWLTGSGWQSVGHELTIDFGGQFTMQANCKRGAANVVVSLGGNTTDSNTDNPMYLISFANATFAAPNAAGVGPPDDNGQYQFVTEGTSILENQTTAIANVERVNGFDGAASIDITDLGTGSCTNGGTDYNTITDETISWAAGVGNAGAGVSIVAQVVTSPPCTIALGFTNAVGGIVSSGAQQTHTVTVLEPTALAAFPGAEGYGTETTHGRGGTVCRVTNTNDTGAGSLRTCLLQTAPRIIIFTVSGTIEWATRIDLYAANSNVYIAGQTAPGDGIAIKYASTGSGVAGPLFQIRDGHDILVRHIRFRQGSPDGDGDLGVNSTADDLSLRTDANNIVFDHNSFTWGNDEVMSFWGNDIYNITFSHNLFAEGMVFCRETTPGGKAGDLGQNVGPLLSGGNPQYRISMHHNYLAHMCFRNYLLTSGSGTGSEGVQFINNVHYNNRLQEYAFSQNQYTGTTAIRADVINDYYKHGPHGGPTDPVPVRVTRSGPGTFQPMSLHLQGSTWRNQDDSVHTYNNESDNFATQMFKPQSDTGYGTVTWTERATPLANQPTNAITTTTAVQAFTDLITNEDVGATKPSLDSVDSRIIGDAKESGTCTIAQCGWASANVPSPIGSASYPTLSTFGALTDTDSDGVPDAYETSPLGTNPNVFEEQAILDHDGDGYSNIEEWIESL